MRWFTFNILQVNKVNVWIWLPWSDAMMFWLDFDMGCYVFISFDFDEGHIPIWLLQFSCVDDSSDASKLCNFSFVFLIFWLNTFYQLCEYLHWVSSIDIENHLNYIMNWHFVDANLFANWSTYNLWRSTFKFLGYIVF